MTRFIFSFIFFVVSAAVVSLQAQSRTVGLFLNDTAKCFKGYTLFAPKQNSMTYLINNEGRIVHQWTKSKYPPGQSVYLLENGHILRSCMTKGKLSSGGGEGGRIEEYDWNDSLIWSLDFSTDTYMQHHDIKQLPNGNIIMLVIEKKTYADCIAAGFDPSKFQPDIAQKGYMVPDYVAEVKPTYPSGGTVVWEWHTWDHLIQDFDNTKSNYGVPKSHPELVDCAGDGRNLPSFWNHMNAIDYNPGFDQIVLSVRGNSECWIIDHGTTTAEAKSHTGGKRGKGGDLLYRWGNPATYSAGTLNDEKYFQQHDVEWVLPGRPGAGDLTCFNNGLGRNYSTIDEITTPADTNGNYTHVTGTAFGPTALTWTYQANPPASLYAEDISGAFRLPNGNTLIDDGPHGTFYEVTVVGTVVWKYICPVQMTGVISQGDTAANDATHPGEKMNSVFRIYKYATDYGAFKGKDLTPGKYIEIYPYEFYDLFVNSGSGTGYYKAGDKITVTANQAPSGYIFDKWTGDVTYLTSTTTATASLTMPAKSISITASYKSTTPNKYNLTVNSGTGSGSYNQGDTVTIIANEAADGYVFEKWTGDTMYIVMQYSDTAIVVMPNKDIIVTSSYILKTPEKYALTVDSGSGSGSYNIGDTITVVANKPPIDYKFDKWTGDTMYIVMQYSDTAFVVMPSKNISLKAQFTLKVSVDEIFQSGIIIFPNPTSDYLYLSCSINQIKIYNFMGQEVMSLNNANTNRIDVSGLIPGLYFLRIEYKNCISYVKITKE